MADVAAVIAALRGEGKTLAAAESCTGGLLGAMITGVPGASCVFLGGVVSYACKVKETLLGVDPDLLERRGAVCEPVARQMAEGVRRLLQADVALAITGNAGPGAEPLNPEVGLIYVACASEKGTVCRALHLAGDREDNRREACEAALELIPI